MAAASDAVSRSIFRRHSPGTHRCFCVCTRVQTEKCVCTLLTARNLDEKSQGAEGCMHPEKKPYARAHGAKVCRESAPSAPCEISVRFERDFAISVCTLCLHPVCTRPESAPWRVSRAHFGALRWHGSRGWQGCVLAYSGHHGDALRRRLTMGVLGVLCGYDGYARRGGVGGARGCVSLSF